MISCWRCNTLVITYDVEKTKIYYRIYYILLVSVDLYWFISIVNRVKWYKQWNETTSLLFIKQNYCLSGIYLHRLQKLFHILLGNCTVIPSFPVSWYIWMLLGRDRSQPRVESEGIRTSAGRRWYKASSPVILCRHHHRFQWHAGYSFICCHYGFPLLLCHHHLRGFQHV